MNSILQKTLPKLPGILILLLAADSWAAETAKQLPPSGTKFKAAQNLVAEAYRSDYESAITRQARQMLVARILRDADATQDVSNRYAAMHAARNIAILDCEVESAFRIIEAIEAIYRIDGLRQRSDVLLAVSQDEKLFASNLDIGTAFHAVIAMALDEDRFDIAVSLSERNLEVARKTRDSEKMKVATALLDEVRRLRSEFSRVRSALAVLKSSPTDASANLIVGKHLCFYKGDWERGLPMLALADEEQIRTAAIADLEQPKNADEQMLLADQWFKIGQGMPNRLKRNLWTRAESWYRKSASTLEGVDRARVQGRLDRLQKALTKAGIGPEDPLQQVSVADIVPSNSDLFDISQGVKVISHSPIYPNFDVAAALGKPGGPRNDSGHLIFADHRPKNTVHFFEFETKEPISLSRIALFASSDASAGRHFSKFVLYAYSAETKQFEAFFTFEPAFPYSSTEFGDGFKSQEGLGIHNLAFTAAVSSPRSKKFRAEFTQRGNTGPRIVELDGF